jgi:hypothetical protein
MREVVDGLGNNPSISILAIVTYWLSQLVGHINEVLSALTGLGAFILLSLTIIGKWYEVQESARKKKKADLVDNGNHSANNDTD